MSRKSREISATGVYHIMLRGINKQSIFEEPEDYKKFLSILKEIQLKTNVAVYAYCLMGNHIHLLLHEKEEKIAVVMKRIGVTYVHWYNEKYQRNGHLFQDRYRSEAVNTEKYFLTVLRYIHQNPLKAGITKNISEYPWSSYGEFFTRGFFVDADFVLRVFSEDKKRARERFQTFHQETEEEQCLDIPDSGKIKDHEARIRICELCDIEEAKALAQFEAKKRNALLKILKSEGISTRQLQRLTGINRGTIMKT